MRVAAQGRWARWRVEGQPRTPEGPGPTAVTGKYLPGLDGLRALAVAAVIAYHGGAGWMAGGYLGVDLFFVLSGFLITSLLLEEWASTARIRLGAFWARRARRLLPALFLLLGVLALFVALDGRFGPAAQSGSVDLPGLRGDGLATVFYVANWHSILAHQSYFAQFSAPSPLQHTWSLAIEEQFYFLWPLILLALLHVAGRYWRRAGIVLTAAGALGSAALMALLFHPGGDPTRVYFGTDTRAFDMLAGATVAMLAAARPQPKAAARAALHVGAPAATVALGVFWVRAGSPTGLPPGWMFRGGFLLCAALGAVVVADVRQVHRGPLAVVLSLPPLRWIGMISYGLYLWHWPIDVFADTARTGLAGAPLQLARLALTLAAATASFYLVERPVRAWRPGSTARLVAYPAAAAVVAGALVVGTLPAVAIPPAPPVHLAIAPVTGPAAVDGAGGFGDQVPVHLAPGRVLSPADPLRITVIGDSFPFVSFPAIEAAFGSTGETTVIDRSFPGWGLSNDPADLSGGLAAMVATDHPDIVIGTWSWDDTAALETPDAYRATLEEALRELLASGDGVSGVLLLQYPKVGSLVPGATAAEALASQEQDAAGSAAWAAMARSMASAFPGRVMYLPVASSILWHGQFSSWLPPVDDPSAPKADWVRVRRVDNVHPCPAGAARYAAAVLADVELLFGVPVSSNAWESGSWSADPVFYSPPGSCPDDHPPT